MKRRILGIDPGTRITGWGIIETIHNRFELIDYGTIKPKAKETAEIYYQIFDGVEKLITQYSPDALSVETQFVHKNIQSAIKLGMARGSILVAAAKNSLPIFEYAPTKAKQAVTGNGSASKFQVAQMTKILLNLKELPSSEDASDALALAIAHANASKIPLLLKQ